ncbi:hypothetical protein ASG12_18745 [Williamsia sp. Leaf354]|jgi:hypothetical protein|uniref:DUF4012 domain-containing protein n=1 Tax=Williamsia sp. Leaf354 TaxID=1736349 RepID=UPI0006F8CC1E|nr:DUF4012 domain-containing protein [Williamsia sp. Leaf354]KQR96233.1 hypothetical protein ASG12_18745 [Williamsia sp. Leaf354]
MTAPSADAPARPRRRRRRILWVLAAIIVLLVVVGLYLGYLAYKAKGDLETARTQATAARAAVLDGDVAKAKAAAAQAQSSSESARSKTHNIVWSAAAAIPWLGSPLDSVAQISDVVADLSTDVLSPIADLATTLDPTTLRTGDKGINTTLLGENEAKLGTIADVAERIDARAADIDGSWFSTVADARDQLVGQTTKTSRFIRGTDTAAKLLPPMLGNNGVRRYFFAFQTPAESRATGGLLGAYAVISARNGRINVDNLGPNSTLRAPARPIDLGAEFDSNYAINRPYVDDRNSNASPHFPYAAQIWMSMWRQQTNTRLDGALATDPIALSYLLKATGPITLSNGDSITGDNVVEVTLSSSYKRFGGDNPARKAYLQEIASKAITTLTTARGNTGGVLEALGRAVHERRLMVYSTRPEEQALLVSSGLAHEVTQTDAPYAEVTVGNLAGNKIDYYLRRAVRYESGSCTGDMRQSTLTVSLTNTATDLSLPAYVIGGLGNPDKRIRPGTNYANLTANLTNGAVLQTITVDGQAPLYGTGTELGHLHVMTQLRIKPGATAVVKYTFLEPTSARGAAVVPVQPLVDEPAVTVDVPQCR